VLECVINVSCAAGAALDAIATAAGPSLRDVHSDVDHHRSVLTLVGPNVEEAARRVAGEAVARLDLRTHVGAHPRIGVVDVVPFVALDGSTATDALAARDQFATWAGTTLALPCFLYGPERTLPEVRRRAWNDLGPDTGPAAPHPSGGACAVGARPVLVAYNLWLRDPDLDLARAIAAQLRSEHVRALGLRVGAHVQVSLNLIAPALFGPAQAFDAVAALAPVARAELVGLVPGVVLDAIDPTRWAELDLAEDRRLER
jgi:glutamate formiminotransferase / 5-formyltetrahydrofolate cyclo-ligase